MTIAPVKKIRVLIVEDSHVVQLLLEQIINSDPRLEVVGTVSNGQDALGALDRLSPDVISMDIRMPVMDGFEATRRIMETRPTPIVVVAASVETGDRKTSMNALKAGALAVVEKPVGFTHADYITVSARLCRQLVLMSGVNLVRQRPRRSSSRPASNSAGTPVELSPLPRAPASGYRILGIVASTGGPNALVQVLGGLGGDFPLPVMVVQHMTASFLTGFISWLDGAVSMPVRLAEDGALAAGCAYVAPADRHLLLDGDSLKVTRGDPVSGQRPSGTVMLESIARSAGARGIGVVLTGMGDDGAQGLCALSAAKGYAIAEDETTAVVYGMPAVAIGLGGVHEALPLPRIAPRLRDLVNATSWGNP